VIDKISPFSSPSLVARVKAIDSPRRIVLYMVSAEIPVYGEQEQSAYNGH
jgi:hypothetical protein